MRVFLATDGSPRLQNSLSSLEEGGRFADMATAGSKDVLMKPTAQKIAMVCSRSIVAPLPSRAISVPNRIRGRPACTGITYPRLILDLRCNGYYTVANAPKLYVKVSRELARWRFTHGASYSTGTTVVGNRDHFVFRDGRNGESGPLRVWDLQIRQTLPFAGPDHICSQPEEGGWIGMTSNRLIHQVLPDGRVFPRISPRVA